MHLNRSKIKLASILVLTTLLSLKITACNGINQAEETNTIQNSRTVQAQSAGGTIQPQLAGETRDISPDFVCYNVNSVRVRSWTQPEFVESVKELSPTTLRIPGGSVGNYWDWERGGIFQDTSSFPAPLEGFIANNKAYTASQLPNYRAGLAATQTKPIFMLNMLSSNLESQLQMLQTAQDLGMPIEYVELGNELYFNIPNYKAIFPTEEDYAIAASQWTAAVKQQFPAAQVSVTGVVPTPNKPNRLQNWNSALLAQALPAAEAITIHFYNDAGLPAQAPNTDTYPFFDDGDVATILGEPFRNWDNLRADRNYEIIPADKDIWITEYNLLEPQPRVAGSWASGLYNLTTSLLFLEEPRVELICNHTLLEGSRFGAIFPGNNSFQNPAAERGMMSSKAFAFTAMGNAGSLLGRAAKNMKFASRIDFPGAEELTGKNGVAYPALYGWIFSNSNNEGQGVIVNLSDSQQEIDINKLFESTVEYEQISGAPQELVDGSGVLTENMGNSDSTIVLPPYSATKVAGDLLVFTD